MQRADVQEVRLLELRDLGLGIRVELGLEPVQRLDDRIGRLDRVRAAIRVRRVPRVRLEGDARPDDADGDDVHAAVRRLGDQRRVGLRPGEDGGERAVPAALLLDHALVDEPARKRARGERGLDAEEHRGHSALHVARPAAVHATVCDLGAERLLRPAVDRLGADDVHMPVEDERAAATLADRSDERAPAFVGHEGDAAVRPLGQARGIGDDRLHLEAELPQARLDELLRRLLLAEQARHANQIGQEPDRVVEAALDRAARVRR